VNQYRADPGAWGGVLGIQGPLPAWRGWQARFAFVAAFLDWAEGARERPLSRYALGAKGRELVEAHQAAFDAMERTRAPRRTGRVAEEPADLLERRVTSLATRMLDQA
jgi:hypothetical protein